MTTIPHITIDMDKRCTQCKKKGALPNDLCLTCALKRIPQTFGKKKA